MDPFPPQTDLPFPLILPVVQHHKKRKTATPLLY